MRPRASFFVKPAAIAVKPRVRVAKAFVHHSALSAETLFNRMNCAANQFVQQELKKLSQVQAILKLKSMGQDAVRDLYDHAFGLSEENKALLKSCIIAADLNIGFSEDDYTFPQAKIMAVPLPKSSL